MSERRDTITRDWRPAAPGRRVDDFQEVPCEPEPDQPQPERPMERRDIDSRLLNWAKWCTTWGSYPRGGDEDSAARACRIAYEAKFGPPPGAGSGERRKIDEDDAKAIERSLWRLANLQRDMLRLHYVWRRQWFSICHIVGIRARRRVFDEKMAAALAELAAILDQEQ